MTKWLAELGKDRRNPPAAEIANEAQPEINTKGNAMKIVPTWLIVRAFGSLQQPRGVCANTPWDSEIWKMLSGLGTRNQNNADNEWRPAPAGQFTPSAFSPRQAAKPRRLRLLLDIYQFRRLLLAIYRNACAQSV